MFLTVFKKTRLLCQKTALWRDNGLILSQFQYFKRIAIAAVVFTFLAAFFEGATVGLIAAFLQGLTNPEEVPIHTGYEWFDHWILATNASATHRFYQLSIVILGMVWLRSILGYLGHLYSWKCEVNLAHRIRQQIFEQLQRLSLSFYTKSRSGELINSFTVEVHSIKQAFGVLTNFVTRGSTLLAYIVTMFWLSWQLSIASILLFSLLSVALSNVIARVREASFAVPRANGHLSSVMLEFINGIRTIQASAAHSFEAHKFERRANALKEKEIAVATLAASVKPLAEGGASTILVMMIIVAFHFLIVDGIIQATTLLTFMFVLFRMMPLVTQVNASRQQLNSFQGSLNNIKQLLRTDNKPYLQNGTIAFESFEQGLELISVDFAYEPSQKVLKNITLSFPKGKTTALVGSSGAGKTTLVDLIPRFYDPTRGSIKIDGIDLRAFDINTLRQKMGIVSQDTFIFNTTVRDNIAYGLGSIEDKTIIKVAQSANAWEFIENLPQGLDTLLGDRGVLSGGQRQRIAIARALLRNPQILILDEATSALDSVTERLIQDSLECLCRGRTVVVIAHRLSTIINADKVIVLEKGQVVEQGNYQELLKERGKLWKYHQMQHDVSSVG